jgi:ATP-binding cassette subfamily B protein
MNYINQFKSFYVQAKAMFGEIHKIDKRLAYLYLLSKSVLAITPLILLYLTKRLIDLISTGNLSSNELITLICFFAGTQIFTSIIGQLSEYTSTLFQQKVSDRFSARIIQKASRVDYTYFEQPEFHNTLHLAQQQALYRVGQLMPAINSLIASGLSLVFLIVFFISIKAYFLLAFIVLAIPISINKWIQGKRLSNLEFTLAPKEREANYFFQILTGIQWAKENRSFQFGEAFGNRMRGLREHIASLKKNIQRAAMGKNILFDILEIGLMTAAIGYLSWQTMAKLMTLGVFVIYLQGFQRMQSSSKSFFQSILQLFQLRIFFQHLFDFFALPETSDKEDSKENFPEAIHSLQLKNISFTYPNATTPILHDISMNARAGQIVAIVGENGSGKSTLVKLLAKLYRPDVGRFEINGISFDNIKSSAFYEHSAFFFQDYEKYFIEAGQNIHFNVEKITEDESATKAAAEQSGADEFIQNLSSGYQTKLGSVFQGSEQLSGGQWQKLALARIFYKEAKLIVLDEPSSALDAFSELRLYEEIKKNNQDKIVILISHRLYNLKLADHIYVMQDGKILEDGTFNTLINQEGLFQQMYEKQRI